MTRKNRLVLLPEQAEIQIAAHELAHALVGKLRAAGGCSCAGFVAAVDEMFAASVTTIHDYRLDRLDLNACGKECNRTSDILIALAHAPAERDQTEEGAESVAASLADPLALLWDTMRECRHVRSSMPRDLVPARAGSDRSRRYRVVDLWRAVWSDLQAPEGHTCYINVAAR